jgi:hypothetical protein
MLEIAAFESKLKMLDEEILRVTRRTRVLDERVLPRVAGQIKTIVHYLGEREREAYYRAFLDRSGQPEAEPPQRQGCDLFQSAWFFEQVACARNDLEPHLASHASLRSFVEFDNDGIPRADDEQRGGPLRAAAQRLRGPGARPEMREMASRFLMMSTSTQTDTAIQICDFTAFSEVPKNALIRRCCLMQRKKSSTCQRAL